MQLSDLNPTVIAAIVGAIASLVILVISILARSLWEKHFLTFKLNQEYKYEQRKKLKDILSSNKIRLLNACESLTYRLCNLTIHYDERWHCVRGEYDCTGYYFTSFVYRFVAVFARIKKIEDEMVYLDTTIATSKDMEFIKFLRLFPQIMYDTRLFDGFEYDPNFEKDHIFANNLELMAESMINEGTVYSFPHFQKHFKEIQKDINCACRFIDGVSPDETRLRWDRLQMLNLTLMVFLNTFGYDFQKTTNDKFKELINRPRESKLILNFVEMVERNKLSNQKEFKRILKIFTT